MIQLYEAKVNLPVSLDLTALKITDYRPSPQKRPWARALVEIGRSISLYRLPKSGNPATLLIGLTVKGTALFDRHCEVLTRRCQEGRTILFHHVRVTDDTYMLVVLSPISGPAVPSSS